MRSAYIGIDVAIAKGKHLPIAVSVQEDGRLIPQRLRNLNFAPPIGAGNIAVLNPVRCHDFALETRDYLLRVCDSLGLIPVRIGIDAPSSPRASSTRRRVAEVALDKAGIRCFATPSIQDFEVIHKKIERHLLFGGSEGCMPHSNQLWMLAGFAIFEKLTGLTECIEVFPQATMRVIGSGTIHKSKPGAVDQQLQAASKYTGWPNRIHGAPLLNEIGWGTPHDRLDAYLSSWVASLSESDRIAFGQPPSDAIWVPRSQLLPLHWLATPDLKRAKLQDPLQSREPKASPILELMCPACGKHLFRRWPWGWDAHAAHKCSGLTETTPEARKAEFSRRFADHF